MIRAFELAVGQLGDPRLRVVIWQSLALSVVLQGAIGALAWWALQRYAHVDMRLGEQPDPLAGRRGRHRCWR